MKINISKWNKQNIWYNQSNDFIVRHGLREEVLPSALRSSTSFYGGFSLRSPNTDEVLHYLFTRSNSTSVTSLRVHTCDESFRELNEKYIAESPPNFPPITYASIVDVNVSNLEFLIASPNIDTYYGVIGGSVIEAEMVDSVNPGTTELSAFPRGLVAESAGRIILCNGRNIYISDAKRPRTFVSANVDALPGTIYGVHTITGNDTLIFATSAGVYGLPADAFASGQIARGLYFKIADIPVTAYHNSCVSNGKVYLLSQKGIRVADTGEEIVLSDTISARSLTNSINEIDFRRHRIYGGKRGPIVATDYGLCVFDVVAGIYSWFIPPEGYEYNLVGLLEERDGSELWVLTDRVVRPHFADVEYSEENIRGAFIGEVPTDPIDSPVVRHVTAGFESGATAHIGVRGTTKTGAVPHKGLEIGVDNWDDTLKYKSSSMRSRTFDFGIRTDEIDLEIAQDGPGNRFSPVIQIETKGPGKRRRSN